MNDPKMKRRNFLQTIGLGSACISAPGILYPAGATSDQKLNIIFILVDDLGWSDLGCYGADLHETPNIDRLARQSMKFTDAYAASPVCTPTRASIMTGKHPARLHMTVWRENSLDPPRDRQLIPPVTQNNLPHDQFTIAEALKQAGYFTAHVGKWHLGGAEHYPETQGFDVNIGGTLWGAPYSFFHPYSGWRTPDEFRYVPHLEFGQPGEYLTDRLTDEAIRILNRVHDRPFFLHLAYHTVHTPIEGKPELVRYYKNKIQPGMNHQNAGFAAMVHSLDENVGRILSKIEELGVAENTVIFFFSDNGGYINRYRDDPAPVTSNHPLRSGKGSLYEGGIRAPLMIRWPGVTTAGSICRQPVCSTDFYPTILSMANAEGDAVHNADLDGVNLTPLLRNAEAQWDRDVLCWHYPHYYFYPATTPVSAIRKGNWKLLEHFEDNRLELFDLENDLGEKNDLAETMPDKANELQDQLIAWRVNVNAQLPSPNQ
ncbi:MAG: DUF4976 domain-containing protein [Candidatus Omnitrophota bacterium]|jgi:arylsulfatase A-like enzyme|nr:MAG: DUF4976 domain-containing protein [Candidatus Omnitrophota bacterium]